VSRYDPALIAMSPILLDLCPAVVVIGRLLHFPTATVAVAGAALCFGLRFLVIRRGWRLPIAPTP
jgi:hypothetical protein